jgi:toxin ParE1/3/4
MNYSVVLDPEAEQEFEESYRFYENVRSGMGDRFAAAIQQAITALERQPASRQIVYGKVRRAVVVGFPFCLYYRIEADIVRILSVFHGSRDPKDWQRRA